MQVQVKWTFKLTINPDIHHIKNHFPNPYQYPPIQSQYPPMQNQQRDLDKINSVQLDLQTHYLILIGTHFHKRNKL